MPLLSPSAIVCFTYCREPTAQVYRDVRAAAESGWDFSSRRFADQRHMATIQTAAIVPVDLNSRWLATVGRVYANTGKMFEKYDVEHALPGGGGEYPVQDGFGWTDGVTRGLLRLYPDLRSASAR